MGEPALLDLLCPSCGGCVTLHVADWGADKITNAAWTCPHCQGPHHIALMGRLVGVSRREPRQVH